MTDHFIFARIVSQFLPSVRAQQKISPQQASSCQNILNCHTEKLGGLNYACDHCGHHTPRYHSCRHRHCPMCQQQASALWEAQRTADILPVPYYHLVFTLPHELNGWAQCHPKIVYGLLFQCVWQTMALYAADNKQLVGQLGMTSVLHTWGQALTQHIHCHCLIPGGVITGEKGFTVSQRDYLYPHRVLAKIFRGKMVSGLRQAFSAGALSRIKSADEVDRVLDTLMQKDWVIHTKPYLKNPETVVSYLARYTYRTAISLSRIKSVDENEVRFRWKDYRDGQQKTMRLSGVEFLRRYLLHILPKGFMRIRHYGYLANRVRVEKLAQIRAYLSSDSGAIACKDKEAKNPNAIVAKLTEIITLPCPKCQQGHLRQIGIILSEKERRRIRWC